MHCKFTLLIREHFSPSWIMEAAVAHWLSSWLAEQGVRGSIPRLATWISEIGYLPLPSRDMAEIPLKRRKSSIQPTNRVELYKRNSRKPCHIWHKRPFLKGCCKYGPHMADYLLSKMHILSRKLWNLSTLCLWSIW